jgi:hypothetical protein
VHQTPTITARMRYPTTFAWGPRLRASGWGPGSGFTAPVR